MSPNILNAPKTLGLRKDPDAGKDWGQEEKGMTEDMMAGWLPRLHGHEFEQTPGDSEEHGNLACYSSRDRKVRHDWVTEQQQQNTKCVLYTVL